MQEGNKLRIFSPGIGTFLITIMYISHTTKIIYAQDKIKNLFTYEKDGVWRRHNTFYYSLDENDNIINQQFQKHYQDAVTGKNQITRNS